MESSFDDVGSFYNGLSGKSKDDFGQGSDRFITYMNVYKNTIANPDGCELVLVEDGEHQNRVEYGDILFTQSSETLEEVGLSSVWLHKASPFLNSFCFGFHFKEKGIINPRFIAYGLRTSYMREQIIREGQGATRYNLSSNRLKPIKLVYPSYQEQSKVASLMSCIEKRIEKQQELICTLKKYKRGALKAVFNQQASFVSESQKWDEYTMRDLISLQSGQDFAPAEYNDQGLGIPYMTGASCIVNGETVVSRWTQTPRCYAYRGDTLLVCKGSGSGAVVKLSQEKVHIARQFMSLRPNEKMTSDFCYYLTVFLSDKIKQNATGLIEGIDRGTVLNQTVFLPPLHEQKKIASFFSKLDFALSSQERLLDKIMSVRIGLMQQLFI